MHHRVSRFHTAYLGFRAFFSEEFVALLLALFVFAVPAGASTRFEPRSLFMNSVEPGATTSYKVSLGFMTPASVGSIDMLFCNSPIPYDPCVTPTGLNVSNVVLANQTGETGFSISVQSENHIVLSRAPQMVVGNGEMASYTFNNVINPSDTSQPFSIRLRSHASTDATGPQIDFGSVRGAVGNGVTIETQVPPMLIFCVSRKVEENCVNTDETYYTDMGTLSDKTTLTAQSQMAVGTNASGGFAITVSGNPLTAGTNVIDAPSVPTKSEPGVNQFGINLVANDELNVGQNPEGTWANAVPTPDYSEANKYKYVPGDVIAYSPNVSLMKKFTVSYIVNSSPNLRAGVYTTTINFIASGRF